VTTRPARSRLLAVSALLTVAASTSLHAQEAKPDVVAPAPAAPAADLPQAREIMLKGVEAIGGKDAMLKIKSIEMKGSIEMPAQGMKGTMIARAAAPNKMLTTMSLGAIGDFKTGFDGTTGWASDKIQGTRILEGKELAMIVRESDFLKDADPLKRWDTYATTAEAKFSGFDCWRIEASKGEEKAVLWYEKSTHLPRGLEMTVETQIGKLPVSTAFLEYKEFNGLKFPVRTEAKQAGQRLVTVYESIVLDAVDPASFELPADVKALLEPEPAEDAETEDGETKPSATPPASKP